MCKCLLCKEREATKKGSHIIPSFFMKRINSIDGCNKRDHELGFSIGLGTVKSYFGRDIYEDIRRNYTDDESKIEDRTNLDIIDNVFCPECEKLFSKYESKYSHIYNLPFDKELVANTYVTGAEAALFWYGVIWRLSATGHSNAKLKPEFEEKLRQIVLSEDIRDSDCFYALFCCKNYRNSNPTFALFDCKDDVAMLIVDEFMMVLFSDAGAALSDEVLWGMNFQCNVSELNNGTCDEKIGLLPNELFEYINDNILHLLAKRIDFRGNFNAIHLTLFGRGMPETIFQEIMTEIGKAKLADIYTIKNYAYAMKTVIQAHPEMYGIRFTDGN